LLAFTFTFVDYNSDDISFYINLPNGRQVRVPNFEKDRYLNEVKRAYFKSDLKVNCLFSELKALRIEIEKHV